MGPSKARYFMIVLASAGLIGSCYGMGINIAGNFFTPVADAFGTGRGTAATTLTIYNLVQAFTGMLAPQAVSKIGLKKVILLGCGMQIISTFLLGSAQSIPVMYVLQGTRGFGAGLAGAVLATTLISHWFNRSNGLMVSIAMCFSGIVGAVMSPLSAGIIASYGWAAGYRLSAFASLLLCLPALLFPLNLTPAEAGMEPYGGREEEPQKKHLVGAFGKISVTAVSLLVVYSFLSSFTSALPQHFPGLADVFGLGSTGALMISVCMVMNSAGKVMLGAVTDRIGARKAVNTFALLVLAGALLIMMMPVKGILLAAAGFYGLTYSIETVGPASITREIFGSENYDRVYPGCALAATLANAAGTSLIGFLYDAQGNYTGTMILILAVLVLALLCLNVLYQMHGTRKV